MYILLFIVIASAAKQSVAQSNGVFHLDTLPAAIQGAGSMIKGNWKYHKGDDIKWANPLLNDSEWQNTPSNFSLAKLPANSFEGIGWFRITIVADTSLVNKTMGLLLSQPGASEIYLDGKLLYSFGKIDTKNPANEERYDPGSLPVDIRFENVRKHVLAVRYANARAIHDFKENEDDTPGFAIRFKALRAAIENKYVESNTLTGVFIFYFTFFLALSFLHLMLFAYYRKNKSNLYCSIFNFSFGIMFIWLLGQQNLLYPDTVAELQIMGRYLPNIYAPALLALLYTIFYGRLLKIFWLWLAFYVIDFVLSMFNMDSEIIYVGTLILFVVESLRVIIASIYKKRDGSWIIGTGVIITLTFFTTYTIISFMSHQINFSYKGWLGLAMGLITILSTLSIPLSMSVYLARDFSRTNKHLEKKLMEVEELSAKSLEQEKEKQQILASQNEKLEEQVAIRTAEVLRQKTEIEEQKHLVDEAYEELHEKNKEVMDSIRYAKRIQTALITNEKYISNALNKLMK